MAYKYRLDKWKQKAKGFGKRAEAKATQALSTYNDVIDQVQMPAFQVGTDNRTTYLIVGALALLMLIFRKKIFK